MAVNPDLVMATGSQVLEIQASFSETTTQSAGTVIKGNYRVLVFLLVHHHR